MKEQFVSLAIAQQLKEKGFDQSCMAYVYTGNTGTNVDQYVYGAISHDGNPIHENYNAYDMSYSLPLWQQVIDWFRDKYSINIWVTNWSKVIRDEFGHKEYESCVRLKDYMRLSYSKYFDSYPEARQAAIEHALTLI